MKKIKSLKTLTTLGAITAITPIIAAACNDKDSNPTQKIDISLLNWSSDGDYDSAMTTVKFIDQFKLNNPAGQNGLPADIYDNVEFDVSGSLNAWTITLTAKEDSTNYIGAISIDITAKINVVSLHWISTGEYNINMDEDDIITTFKQNNPAGQHGLPEDVYNNVDVTNDSEFKWVINIKAKDKSKAYIGTESISISVCGNITYNGVVYELPDNIDVNCFCGTGEWNIPTKDNGNLTIQYHTGITEINFPANISNTKINDYFLFNCDNLKTVDFTNFNSVKSIGNRFLFGCGSLEQVNLDGLYNVKEIGFSFMYGCGEMKKIDLTGLKNVESIGDYFLMNCVSLEDTFDMSPLVNIKSIGSDFISECSKIKTVIMTDLVNLTSIGNNFLLGDTSLKDIKIDNIPNLETIGDCFMYECKFIKKIDLSSCQHISSIGTYFLTYCDNLETINLGNIKASTIKNSNFSFALSNKTLALYKNGVLLKGEDTINITSKFPNDYADNPAVVRNIYSEYDNTMNYNGLLYNLDYDIDPNVFSTVSGTDFIEQNIPLKNKKFVKIGGDRVKWQKLTSIVFKHISPNCRKLNEHFLVCTEISTIDFSSFSQITHVGWSFLGTCLSLVYINMSYLTKVQEIGREFLYGCSALQKLYVPLKNPKTITVKSKDFMILTPLACTIHAGDFVDEYKTTSPWSGRAQHIVE